MKPNEEEPFSEARRIVDEQAEDDGLWFVAHTAPEAYLQQELRRLHAAVEREPAPSPPISEAREAIAHTLVERSRLRPRGDRVFSAVSFAGTTDAIRAALSDEGYTIVPASISDAQVEAAARAMAEWGSFGWRDEPVPADWWEGETEYLQSFWLDRARVALTAASLVPLTEGEASDAT